MFTKVIKILFLIVLSMSSHVYSAEEVYLGDLGWDQSASTIYGIARVDKNRQNTPLRVNNKVFEKGIGTHANSTIVFNLAGDYTTFKTEIGIDDTVGERGSVVFSIVGDDIILYTSAELTGIDPEHAVELDIQGVQTLKLIVDGGQDIHFDHANWLNARVVRQSTDSPATYSSIAKDTNQNTFGYNVFLPASFYESTSSRLPVVVFFHGKGQRGDGSIDSLNNVNSIGLPRLLSAQSHPIKEFLNTQGVIVIAPQTSAKWWNSVWVTRALEMVQQQLGGRIDQDRIYLTGLSSGSYGILDFLANNPTKAQSAIAAIVGVAHAGNSFSAESALNFDKTVPYWNISRVNHGIMQHVYAAASNMTLIDTGSIVTVTGIDKPGDPVLQNATANFIDGAWLWSEGIDNASGPRIKVTSLAAADDAHNAWSEAYQELGIYQWLLSHTND